jgi:hypothetical protein
MSLSQGLESYLASLRAGRKSTNANAPADAPPAAVEKLEPRRLMALAADVYDMPVGPVQENNAHTVFFSATRIDAGHVVDHWVINWGDGSAAQTLGGAAFTSAEHTWLDGTSSYTVTGTVFDDGGGTVAGTYASHDFVVTVEDVDPTFSLTGNATAWLDEAYTLTRTSYGDVNADPPTKWVVDWGDGYGAETFGGSTTEFTHTYGAETFNTITMEVFNKDTPGGVMAPILPVVPVKLAYGLYIHGGGPYAGNGAATIGVFRWDGNPIAPTKTFVVTVEINPLDAAFADVWDANTGQAAQSTNVSLNAGNNWAGSVTLIRKAAGTVRLSVYCTGEADADFTSVQFT